MKKILITSFYFLTSFCTTTAHEISQQVQDLENIGTKSIIITVHGVAAKDSFLNENTTLKTNKKNDILIFKWEQEALTSGLRDKNIICGAKQLSHLILDIFQRTKSRSIATKKTIDPKIIIIAHSMGGNVAKAALNMLMPSKKNPQQATKSGLIQRFVNTIITIFKHPKISSDTATHIVTRRYFENARNKIQNRMEHMDISKTEPLVEAIYFLGTPHRKEYPFNENTSMAKIFYNIFSAGDKLQKYFGFVCIKPTKKTFNIQVQIKKTDDTLTHLSHIDLAYETDVMDRILDINQKFFNENLTDIKTITVTIPTAKTGELKFEFNTEKLPKEHFIPRIAKPIELPL